MKIISTVIALALCITLSACSTPTATQPPAVTAQPAAAATQTPTPSTAPTPVPTPTAMSVKDAGQFYLNEVCQQNSAQDVLANAADATPFKLSVATDAAAKWQTALRHMADTFSAKDLRWPDTVSGDISGLVETTYPVLALAGTLAQAKTDNEFFATTKTAPDKNQAVSAMGQKIRVKLGLSSDLVGSCKTNG